MKKNILLLSVLSFFSLPSLATTCDEVQFSDELYERFPKIDEACIRVLDYLDEKYINLEGKVVRASSETISLRWQRADGTYINDVFKTKPLGADFRVEIDGKSLRPFQMEKNQEVRIYVKVGGTAATLVAANETIETSLNRNNENSIDFDAEMLPKTASPLPLLGFAGVMLIGLAILVRRYRLIS